MVPASRAGAVQRANVPKELSTFCTLLRSPADVLSQNTWRGQAHIDLMPFHMGWRLLTVWTGMQREAPR